MIVHNPSFLNLILEICARKMESHDSLHEKSGSFDLSGLSNSIQRFFSWKYFLDIKLYMGGTGVGKDVGRFCPYKYGRFTSRRVFGQCPYGIVDTPKIEDGMPTPAEGYTANTAFYVHAV